MTAVMKLVVDNGSTGSKRGPGAMLAKVHIARKALGMLEDDYRALLERLTGNRSAKDCTDRQLATLLAEFERMGWRTSGGKARRAVGGSQIARKALAMWISLYQLGAVDDGSDMALEAFGRRQLRVDRLAWADERQGYKLIEALKAMADRHGWDQRVPARMATADRVRLLKDRLVGAQLARLAAAGIEPKGPIAADRADWPIERLESAATELTARVRALPKPP